MDAGGAAYLVKKLGLRGVERVEGYEIRRSLHVAFQKEHGDLAELLVLLDRQLAARQTCV